MSSTRSLIVDASGATAGSYKTIESALEKIPHGGSILVKPGIYRESVSLNSHVQLIAESGAVIQATDGPALHLTADSVTEISGFELIADTVSECIVIEGGSHSIFLCEIIAADLSGIVAWGPTTNVLLKDCKIHGSKQAGVAILENKQIVLQNNEIFDNCHGVAIQDGVPEGEPPHQSQDESLPSGTASVLLEGNNIHDNHQLGVRIDAQSRVILDRNIVSKNRLTGVFIAGQSTVSMERNTISNNVEIGVRICKQTTAYVAKNTISNNKLSGIFVTEASHVTLRSNTVLENSQIGIRLGEGSQGVIEDNVLQANMMIGLLIDKSSAIVKANKIRNNAEFGILAVGGSSASISENDIHHNSQTGVSITGHETSVELHLNTIRNNTGAGVRIGEHAQVSLTKNSLYENTLSGVILTEHCAAKLDHNEIRSNAECGVLMTNKSSALMSGNSIENNQHDGISAHNVVLELTENRVISNRSGMALVDSHCTCSGNQIHANSDAGVHASSSAVISLHDTEISGSVEALTVSRSSQCTCFTARISASQQGIQVLDSSLAHLSGVTLTDCAKEGILVNGSQTKLSNCDVSRCASGLVILPGSAVHAGENSFHENVGSGVQVSSGSTFTHQSNTSSKNGAPDSIE